MDKILIDSAVDAGAEVRTGCPVEHVIIANGRAVGVATRDGEIRARLVVGADGRNSTVAESVGASEYCTRPAGRLPTWAFYEGVDPAAGFYFGTVNQGPGRGSSAYLGLPLDGCFLASVNVPMDQGSEFLADRYANFETELARFPELADALRGATRVGPCGYCRSGTTTFAPLPGTAGSLSGTPGISKTIHWVKVSPTLSVKPNDSLSISNVGSHTGRWTPKPVSGGDGGTRTRGRCTLPTASSVNRTYRLHLADTLFGIGARDANAAQRFAQIFNKGVAPLRILTARQLAGAAPLTVAKIVAESRHDNLRSLRALLDMARFAAMLVAQHPVSPLGARRYRPAAS